MDSGTGGSRKNELDIYLSESSVDMEEEEKFNLLKWWRLNIERFHILSRMAGDILAIPISTVASESAFSTSGRVLDAFRSCLTPRLIEALICVQDWIKSPNYFVSVEESIEALEEFEKGQFVLLSYSIYLNFMNSDCAL